MLIGWLAVLAILPVADPKPDRPTDAQLLADMVSDRPTAQVLEHAGRDLTDGDGRFICGLAQIDGLVEPFTAYTVWNRDHWLVGASAPGKFSGSAARPWNALARKQALSACPDLAPPAGVVWDTDHHQSAAPTA